MWKENEHPRNNRGRFIPKADSANELVEYIKMVLNGEAAPERVVVADINDKSRRIIEKLTGEPLNAKYHTLAKSEINHIEKRHGVYGKADHSMENIEEYKKLPEVLNDFDEAELIIEKGKIQRAKVYIDRHGEKAKLIRFKKFYAGNMMVVVEAITDTKQGNLVVLSLRQQKKTD